MDPKKMTTNQLLMNLHQRGVMGEIERRRKALDEMHARIARNELLAARSRPFSR